MPIDMSAAKAPPTRSGRKAPVRQAATVQTSTMSSLEMRQAGLMGIGQLGQGLCYTTKQYAQAATFGMHWQPLANEIANLAESQPVVAKYVDLIITAGPYAALIQAAVPFIMQTAANYGLINAENVGVGGAIVSPQVLEAQMKADMARAQAEAIRQHQAAMEEAARAQREYEDAVRAANQAREMEVQNNVNNHGWDQKLHDTAAVSK